jgi:hypothetical protein
VPLADNSHKSLLVGDKFSPRRLWERVAKHAEGDGGEGREFCHLRRTFLYGRISSMAFLLLNGLASPPGVMYQKINLHALHPDQFI